MTGARQVQPQTGTASASTQHPPLASAEAYGALPSQVTGEIHCYLSALEGFGVADSEGEASGLVSVSRHVLLDGWTAKGVPEAPVGPLQRGFCHQTGLNLLH